MNIGYLPSCFDLINVRDLDLVSQAAARCTRLVVGVLTDELAERLTGRRPVVPLAERIALVSHVRGVEEVVVHDDVRLSELGPHTVVFGPTDEPAPWDMAGVVALTPARHTQSTVLRHVLRDTEREAVA